MRSDPRGPRGQTLAIAVMLMAVALIMVPLLVSYVQNEAKWTIKQGRSNAAYHLAEAGQDRAIWYLVLSTANWSSALTATPQTGYAGDIQYSDLPGGAYTISFSSGPAADEVTVVTKGRSASGDVRAISAVYSGTLLLSGFVAQGGVDYPTTFTVYWGQVTSYTSITLGAATYHPIKVSKGAISPLDSNPTPPNSDSSKAYSAYDASLTSPPTIDFSYYREKAKLSRVPDPAVVDSKGSHGSQTVTWRGTGYFDGGTKAGGAEVKFKNYTVNCSTCVIFVELDKVKTDGSGYLRLEGLIIYSSNIHIHSTGANPYVVSVPTDAWKQYEAGTVTTPTTPDSAALDQYPGDGGYHSVTPTYTIPSVAFDGVGNTGMSFHGFMYTNSFDCNGGVNSNVGQFQIGPGGTSISTMIIYFDPAVAGSVKYTKSTLRRTSWNEIVSSWP